MKHYLETMLKTVFTKSITAIQPRALPISSDLLKLSKVGLVSSWIGDHLGKKQMLLNIQYVV